MTKQKAPPDSGPSRRERQASGVDDEDRRMFRDAASGARPVSDDRVPPPRPSLAPQARFSRRDEREALTESWVPSAADIDDANGERLSYSHASVGQRTLRKLARGKFSVQAETDLHGMTVAEAHAALQDFLSLAVQRGHRCVRVIHGKGLGSGIGGPVIKPHVNAWLRRRGDVLAFVSAKPVHGGTGALYVLLRQD